jgi:hypothetical protein
VDEEEEKGSTVTETDTMRGEMHGNNLWRYSRGAGDVE